MSSVMTVGGILAVAAAGSLAWWKGGDPERIGSATIAGVWVVSAVTWKVAAIEHFADFNNLESLVSLVGAAAASFVFLFLAIKYSSWWLGAAMLAEALEFGQIAHFLGNLEDYSTPHLKNDYILHINLISLAVLAILIGGTLAAWRGDVVRRRREAERSGKPTPPRINTTLLA